MYIHRPLAEEDLERICTFPQSAEELFYMSPRAKFPLTPEQILELRKGRYDPTVIVEESTGRVAAYANIYDAGEEVCWLGNVIVSPDYRGKGAAEALIRAMLRLAKENHGAKRLLLSCHNTNSRGLAFYHKHGFRPFDIRISTLDDGRRMITIQMDKETGH